MDPNNSNLADRPFITVVVPVRNDAKNLHQCLVALRRSTYVLYEIIVVDDASTDETADVARRSGARVLCLERRSGPAAARNHAVQQARGQYILFIDADVCVSTETLGQFAKTFAEHPDVAAIFGSYDDAPVAPNFISQYKNLFHHFVHQQGKTDATTFWTGCGAVRRSVFLQIGGFAAHYDRPCIEDIELGTRLSRAGHKILLQKEIQVTHRKRLTLLSLLKSDIFHRAIPWSQLILRERIMPDDLNLKQSQRQCALVVGCLLLLLLIGGAFSPNLLLLPVLVFASIALLDKCSNRRGCTWWMSISVAVALVFSAGVLTSSFGWWLLVPLILIIIFVSLNWRLFCFYARAHDFCFAIAVLPVHMLYFTYSSVAFVSCVCCHRLFSGVPQLARPSTDAVSSAEPQKTRGSGMSEVNPQQSI